jgi:hypothetical protein
VTDGSPPSCKSPLQRRILCTQAVTLIHFCVCVWAVSTSLRCVGRRPPLLKLRHNNKGEGRGVTAVLRKEKIGSHSVDDDR